MLGIVSLLSTIVFPFVVLDSGDFGHMMDMDHMMDWWGMPSIGFWWIAVWVVQFILAFIIYKDAEERRMNGLLWLLLVIIPWIGILFLIIYVILKEEKIKHPSSQKNALEVLDARYAKGEITRVEYQQKKKDIEKKN